MASNPFNFDIPAGDASIALLGNIFGSMNGVLSSSNSTGLLGAMFLYFNTVILTVAALVVVYVTVVGVMMTAQEGEFMGKHWNKLWLPIRMVIGIASLVPTASGFSTIQIVLMWIVVQGIGAADMLWQSALSYVKTSGSPYVMVGGFDTSGGGAAPQPMLPNAGVNINLKTFFTILACDATAKQSFSLPPSVKKGSYYCAQTRPPAYCAQPLPIFVANKTTYSFGPAGQCGTVTLCNRAKACSNPNSPTCEGCKAQYAVMQNIMEKTLYPVAQQFAQADYQYRDFYNNSSNADSMQNHSEWSWIGQYCNAVSPSMPSSQCCVPSLNTNSNLFPIAPNPCLGGTSFPSPNGGESSGNNPQGASDGAVNLLYQPYALKTYFPPDDTNTATPSVIDIATDEYMHAIQAAVTAATKPVTPSAGKDVYAEAGNTGWMLAGGYYYFLGRQLKDIVNAPMPDLKTTGMKPNPSLLKDYRNNTSAASELVGLGSADAGGAAVNSVGKQSLSNMANNFSNMGKPGLSQNPILQLQIAGYTMILSASIIYFVLLLLVAFTALGSITVSVLGNSVTNPVGPGLFMLYMIIAPLVWALLLFLVTMGGILAIYIPLIPFIVFTSGAITWMIAVIEAMVAGPLVALGILSPSGQHELMGKAEGAIGMIFNIFLRPTLMLFGFFASMLLVAAVVKLINYAFWGVVFTGIFDLAGVGQGGAIAAASFNPIAFVMFFIAYIYFLLAAVNQCFSLIHLLPAQVLGWMGVHGAAPGGQDASGEALRKAEGGVSGVSGGVTSGMDKGKADSAQYGEGQSQAKDRQKKADEATKLNAGKSNQ